MSFTRKTPSPSFMEKVGRFVVRRRRLVIVLWFLVLVIGVALAGPVTSRLSSNQDLPGLPSYTASQQILHIYGTGGDNPPAVLDIHSPTGPALASAAGRAELAADLAALDRDPTLRVLSYANTGDTRLVSKDGRSAAVVV